MKSIVTIIVFKMITNNTPINATKRRFDAIIFGATGLLGRYTCEQFALQEKMLGANAIKWAAAARNKQRIIRMLRFISVELGKDLEMQSKLVADCGDYDSLLNMCKQCKVLVNCVGPYISKGENVVKACLECGTHYLDASVEAFFLEEIQLKYQKEAVFKKVYIIQSAGFSSLIYELGLLYATTQFRGTINSCEAFLKIIFSRFGHRFNFSFFTTFVEIIANNEKLLRVRRRLYRDFYPKQFDYDYGLPLRTRIFSNPYRGVVNGYCMSVNSGELSTMKRTQHWLFERQNLKPIQVRTFYVFSTYLHPILWFIFFIFVIWIRIFNCTFWLFVKFIHYFTFGVLHSKKRPNRQQVMNTSSEIYLCCEGWKDIQQTAPNPKRPPDSVLVLKYEGGDPFYQVSPMCLYYSTFVLIREQSKFPVDGGVLTPGVAFKDTTLIEKIIQNGSKFEVIKEYKKII